MMTTATEIEHVEPGVATGDAFVIASCRYPSGLLDASLSGDYQYPGPADRAELALIAWHKRRMAGTDSGNVQCPLLQLGDQIYVDATAGMFDPHSLSARFDRHYMLRDREKSPVLTQMARRFSKYPILDDHEIDDNWEPCIIGEGKNLELMQRGRENYRWRQRMLSPIPMNGDRVWHGDSALFNKYPIFFVDTRTERSLRNASSVADAHMFSAEQLDALISWLRNTRCHDGRPRFVASPSMLLPRRLLGANRDPYSPSAIRCDAWEGYPRTLHALLSAVYELDLSDVIFLSGDEHLGSHTTITLSGSRQSGRRVTVHSVHCSPLYAPFTFANSKPADFAAEETILFPRWQDIADAGKDGQQLAEMESSLDEDTSLLCQVSAAFTNHVEGFIAIDIKQAENVWQVEVAFHNADGEIVCVKRIELPGSN